MKKFLFITLAASILFGSAQAADLSQPHITVYGEAEESVAPDRIVWYLNVNNRGTVLKDVADRHSRIIGEVLDFLKQAEIDPDTIQTSRMQFGENWAYRNGTRVKEGYYAATDITFKLSDMDQYADVWMTLSEHDELNVTNVTFEISDEEIYFQGLRRKALLAAREKAGEMADTLGTDIGEPLVIEEEIPSSARPYAASYQLKRTEADALGGAQAVAPGKITLQKRVTVIFRLINPAQ